MRKLLILVLVSVLVFGCKKDEQTTPVTSQQEVSFAANLVDPGAGLKDWECKVDINGDLLEPDYAKVIIGGVTYWPQVFRIDGVLYTQNIKLDIPDNGNSTTYMLTEFVLYDDGGTTEASLPGADDQIVMGTPAMGSDYEVYITESYQFEYELTVTAFEKAEYQIEVLCFQDDEWDMFGFDWFVIDEIVIREQCFFGDICIKSLDEYANSPYVNQSTGIQLDMPALMELKVFGPDGNQVPYSPFTNNTSAANYGVGSPLCIQYPDNLNVDDETFTVELWIMVADGDDASGFAYNLFHTWTFDDEEMIPDGDDGIVEIVLGECNLMGTDLQLVPYQNLPPSCKLVTGSSYAPGPLGTYFDVTLYDIGPGYDIGNNTYGVYCGEQSVYINLNTTYDPAYVYGSIEPLPSGTFQQQFVDNIDQANWLMNNLENYPGYTWVDIQYALWMILDAGATIPHDGLGPVTQIANDMIADAASYGDGYLPLPGGWAAVIFDCGTEVQVIFTFVDP